MQSPTISTLTSDDKVSTSTTNVATNADTKSHPQPLESEHNKSAIDEHRDLIPPAILVTAALTNAVPYVEQVAEGSTRPTSSSLKPKIKLRVSAPSAGASSSTTASTSATSAGSKNSRPSSAKLPKAEEQDELEDDELWDAAAGPETAPPPAKKPRTSKASTSKAKSKAKTIPVTVAVEDDVMSELSVAAGDGGDQALNATATHAPTPPVKATKKKATKPKASSASAAIAAAGLEDEVFSSDVPPVASSSRPRRVSTKKKEEPEYSDDGEEPSPVPQSTAVSKPQPVPGAKWSEGDPLTAADIPYIIDSGLYKLAPSQPLVTKLFPVQAIPRGSNTGTIVYALDKSALKPRQWKQNAREMRTIAGGKWKVKTWSGGAESEWKDAQPSLIPQVVTTTPHENSPAPSSLNTTPMKGGPATSKSKKSGASRPKKTLASALVRDEFGLGATLGLGIDSRPSSAPHTREHSVDTEMLSLAGEVEPPNNAMMDIEDELIGGGSGLASHSHGRRPQGRISDLEMDDFLAE